MLVNPHDIVGTADAIHRALLMPVEERRERWTVLDAAIRAEDLSWWRLSFLRALETVGGPTA